MAGEDDGEGSDMPSWKDRMQKRMPEAGVGFFGTFLLALAIGFLLAISGQLTLAMIVFAVAIVSILATLLTPSPAAKVRRVHGEATPSEEGEEEMEEGEDGTEEKVEARPDLQVDFEPAPTSRPRGTPEPPPEPPPMEDVVVDLGDGDEADADDDEVWVE